MTLQPIRTDAAPEPAGHYSQAIVHAGMVYVAGQLAIDPSDPARAPGNAGEQTERTLRNVEAILHAAGSSLDRIVQMTVYVTDVALWSEVNAACARILGAHRPARAIVPVPALRHGCVIEIQVIAAAG